MTQILVRNRQRTRRVRATFLVRIASHLLDRQLRLAHYALGVQLLSAARMTQLNESWLQHAGPTDVITFDHRDLNPNLELCGEIYLCPEQATIQARQFRVPWPVELTRHLVHGVLHLQGFSDTQPHARARMKRREDQLLRGLRRTIDLNRISGEP